MEKWLEVLILSLSLTHTCHQFGFIPPMVLHGLCLHLHFIKTQAGKQVAAHGTHSLTRRGSTSDWTWTPTSERGWWWCYEDVEGDDEDYGLQTTDYRLVTADGEPHPIAVVSAFGCWHWGPNAASKCTAIANEWVPRRPLIARGTWHAHGHYNKYTPRVFQLVCVTTK